MQTPRSTRDLPDFPRFYLSRHLLLLPLPPGRRSSCSPSIIFPKNHHVLLAFFHANAPFYSLTNFSPFRLISPTNFLVSLESRHIGYRIVSCSFIVIAIYTLVSPRSRCRILSFGRSSSFEIEPLKFRRFSNRQAAIIDTGISGYTNVVSRTVECNFTWDPLSQWFN